MKLNLRFPLLTLLVVAGLASCKTEDPVVPPADMRVTLTYDTNLSSQPAEMAEVVLTSVGTGEKLTAVTNASGVAEFKQIAVGTYNLTAKRQFTADAYRQFTGLTVAAPVLFQASMQSIVLTSMQGNTQTLVLKAGATGDWVIKQLYYAGSDRTDGALFRDQFIELYNNSDTLRYADGLYFAQLDGNRSIPAGTRPVFLLPSNQYDWSKSIGMPGTVKANDDFVYTRTLFQLPGTGRQYPVEPGKSVVIAQTALNHKAPFTGNDGKAITAKNPDLTIDLSKATFEAFFGRGLDSDIDNPAVPNIRVIQPFGTDMILDNSGRDGYAVFRSATDAADLPKYPRPNTTAITTNTDYFYQIPKRLLLDAVECQESPSKLIPRKLTDELDAGYTFTPKGSFTSQAVIRKVARTFGTRRVLQDTNNSTDDFQPIDRPKPFEF